MAALSLTLASEAIILLAFLAGSAFFSICETSMIGVNRVQVKKRVETGSRRAKLLDHMLDQPERLLSTVLIGNNLVNIGATAFATVVALDLFGARGAVIATGVMAVLIILVSELIPKTIAVQNPLPIALTMAIPLRVAESILKPLVIAGAGISRLTARLFGFKAKGEAPFITQDEIQMLVSLGVEGGEVAKFEQRVIKELFQFTETDVHKVMTPAALVHYLPKEATLQQAAEMMAKEGRTRVLVVDGGFERVLGCVHVRDLLRFTDLELARMPVTQALRGVLFSSHDTPADRLLVRMQKEHRLLAVIQGEGGDNLGIATVEDLLEELVGEIHDEFDAARGAHGHAAREAAQETRQVKGPGAPFG